MTNQYTNTKNKYHTRKLQQHSDSKTIFSVIPISISSKLGLQAGMTVSIHIHGNKIIMEKSND